MNMFSPFYGSILWLATCIGFISAQSQIFISARVGSSVVLPCDWRNVSKQSPHVEWRTFAETVFERMGGELYQAEGYEGRVDVPEDKLQRGDCSLELKNIRPADEGVYESYLLVRRNKRSLNSKRVFLQSVELSVDETPEKRSNGIPAVTGTQRLPWSHPCLSAGAPESVILALAERSKE
ncbi:hypothetical protein AOLI_G00188320 [Acnodon oligacanthus]